MIDNKFLCFCVLTTILIQDTQCKADGYSDPIEEMTVGSWPAAIEDHPYQVYLKLMFDRDIGSFCGGSIISPRFILTAAHCVYDASFVEVRAGSAYSDCGGMTYTSTRFIIHPYYNSYYDLDYDVAIIDLQTYMLLDGLNMRTVELPPIGSSVQPGMKLVVAGWGDIKEGGPSSKTLMALEIPTISNERCESLYSRWGQFITPRMFCTVAQGGIGACRGDSGGAAVDVATGVQVGLVSWVILCGHPETPDVYTDLTHSDIRDWIKFNTGV